MRARAKVDIVTLPVKTDLLPFAGMLFNQFHLIFLVFFFHQGNRVRGVQFKTLKRKVLLDDFLHFLFNGFHIVRRESAREVEVVIKPVFNCRADGEPRFGEEVFHSLRHNVRSRVPVRLFSFGVVKRQNLQFTVTGYGGAQIHRFSVQLARASSLVQSGSERLCNPGNRYAVFKLLDVAFQADFYHNDHPLLN